MIVEISFRFLNEHTRQKESHLLSPKKHTENKLNSFSAIKRMTQNWLKIFDQLYVDRYKDGMLLQSVKNCFKCIL